MLGNTTTRTSSSPTTAIASADDHDASLRQRKAKDKRNSNDEYVEPLDEDDQARMIEHLQAQMRQQQEAILQIFAYLCNAVAVVLSVGFMLASPLISWWLLRWFFG